MTPTGRMLRCVGILWLALEGVQAAQAPVSPEGPFEGIVERNVFGLRPPPQPEDHLPPAPPVKIALTGITTILGNKRALLSAQTPGKPPEFLMLTEGQQDGNIQVLKINEFAGTVKLSNDGVPQTLDFTNNGVKLQAGPVTTLAGARPLPRLVPSYNRNTFHPPVAPNRIMRVTPPNASANRAALQPTAPRLPR